MHNGLINIPDRLNTANVSIYKWPSLVRIVVTAFRRVGTVVFASDFCHNDCDDNDGDDDDDEDDISERGRNY